MQLKKQDKITNEKLADYFKISQQALEEIKKNIARDKEKEAREIIEMVECYIKDAAFFEKKGDFVNALSSLAYAYGWIDCGARLKIFNVNNRKLFTSD
ncbi:MAG: DUF357 domain-containing protein [Candidatus Pacearchaeota archaeon]